jgi:prenyl protein peptidase
MHGLWACLVAACVPVAFVAPFYMGHVDSKHGRHDPRVVWTRSMSAVAVTATTVALVHMSPWSCGLSLTQWLGLLTMPLASSRIALQLVLQLYAGRWVQLLGGSAPIPYGRTPLHITLRNLLIAPIVEEFLFRGCVCRILSGGGLPPAGVVLVSSLVFSMAHVHHVGYAVLAEGQRWAVALQQGAFQCAYTVPFGAVAAHLYLKTGDLASPLLLHVFCNWLGVPEPPPWSKGVLGRAAWAAGWLGPVCCFANMSIMSKQPSKYALCAVRM